jgi:hypothetical protein
MTSPPIQTHPISYQPPSPPTHAFPTSNSIHVINISTARQSPRYRRSYQSTVMGRQYSLNSLSRLAQALKPLTLTAPSSTYLGPAIGQNTSASSGSVFPNPTNARSTAIFPTISFVPIWRNQGQLQTDVMLVWQFVAHAPHARILAQDLLPHFEKRRLSPCCTPPVSQSQSFTSSLPAPSSQPEENRKKKKENRKHEGACLTRFVSCNLVVRSASEIGNVHRETCFVHSTSEKRQEAVERAERAERNDLGQTTETITGMTGTHLHTRTLVRRKHLERNLLRARCDPVKLDVDLGLREVVDTAYPRHIECITQIDRGREDAVVDFCSTTSSVLKRSGQSTTRIVLQREDSFCQSNVKGEGGDKKEEDQWHTLRRTHPLVSCIRLE